MEAFGPAVSGLAKGQHVIINPIIGSRALLAEDMAPSIELVASGKVEVGGFVTATCPLERAAEAFEEFERNPGPILRIVIDSAAH